MTFDVDKNNCEIQLLSYFFFYSSHYPNENDNEITKESVLLMSLFRIETYFGNTVLGFSKKKMFQRKL